MHQNPYAPPAYAAVENAMLANLTAKARPVRALGRWLLICAVSAAPSFFWGCALQRDMGHILGMIAGILVFVVAYTAAECTPYYHQIISLPHVHRTALIGYGTRILISLIFPVGLFIDMLVGSVSLSIAEAFLGLPSQLGALPTDAFFSFFLTTLVQGLLLNALLFGYMAGVYGLLRTTAAIRSKVRCSTSSAAEMT